MRLRPWAIIGNPENRRVLLFQQALASRCLPPAVVLSYHGLLEGRESLDAIPENAIVRFDSPGENFAVEKLLLATGSDAAQIEGVPFLDRCQLASLDQDHGRILNPRQWYLGLMATYSHWFDVLHPRRDLTLTSSLHDLHVMFDKRLCHQVCYEARLPVPHSLGTIKGWDELLSRAQQSRLPRLFVKLANGSSASGVVALRIGRDSLEAITSVEMVRTAGELRLYNSLRIRRYTSPDDVRDLINALAAHQIHVEEWLPKATLDRRVLDLRVVVVGGRPQQTVVRTSRSPLTNLHLGNRRGALAEVLARMSAPQWQAMQETCVHCARIFADSLHLGLDLLFTPGFRRHYLLEVNAFGDLLPGVLHEGCDTYQSEIDCCGPA